MGSVIRLLGPPAVESEGGSPRLPGRKSWALLAAIVLDQPPPSRQALATRLFGEADDPLGTLRWHLLQVRRAIAPAEIVEESGRLTFTAPPGTVVDVLAVVQGTVTPEQAGDVCRGTLLEGMSFDDSPAFDLWLSLQRSRAAAATADVLRWAATMLALKDPATALRLVDRALLHEPFDDALQELAVDIHIRRGDRAAAEAHVERARRLYAAELGVDLPEGVMRPLHRPALEPGRPRVSVDISARTLIRVAHTRLEVNDNDRALDAARRAASSAAATGDRGLEAAALMTLAQALIHTLPGRDHESMGLLSRALQLATEMQDFTLLSDIEREIGFIALLDARYGAAETALGRSMHWAAEAGDRVLDAKARTFRACSESDRTDYATAEEDLEQALEALAHEEHRGHRGYTRGHLARVQLRTGRLDDAAQSAIQAFDEIENGGWHGTGPWPLAQLGEAMLLRGDADGALRTFERGFALAVEYPDPCWESLSLRGVALCQRAAGQPEQARETLADALGRARRASDTWGWAVANVLTDLVEIEQGRDSEHVLDAARLAFGGPMPDLAERLRSFLGPLQTQFQTPAP